MEKRIAFTQEEIVLAMLSPFYVGFSGETCQGCKKTANIIVGEVQWKCSCGAVSGFSARYPKDMHEQPNMGPSIKELKEANEVARQKRFTEMREHFASEKEKEEEEANKAKKRGRKRTK